MKIKAQFLNSECYVSVKDYQKNCYQECLNMIIFEYSGPLFYLNIESFKSLFERNIMAKIEKQSNIKAVIMDFSTINFIDEAGVRSLEDMQKDLKHVRLILASLSPQIIRQLHIYNYSGFNDRKKLYLTVHDAVYSES